VQCKQKLKWKKWWLSKINFS